MRIIKHIYMFVDLLSFNNTFLDGCIYYVNISKYIAISIQCQCHGSTYVVHDILIHEKLDQIAR